jgi:predicted Zn-dependent protease
VAKRERGEPGDGPEGATARGRTGGNAFAVRAAVETRRPRVSPENYFNELARTIDRALAPGERHATWFSAEDTDFVRLNRGKVRQPGHVAQRYIEIRLIHGVRHVAHTLSLSGDPGADDATVEAAVKGLRDVLPEITDDPHLLLP